MNCFSPATSVLSCSRNILRFGSGIHVVDGVHAFEDGDIAYAWLKQDVSPNLCHRNGALAGSGKEMVTADASVEDGDVLGSGFCASGAKDHQPQRSLIIHTGSCRVRDTVSYPN